MKKFLILLSLSVITASCSGYRTHGKFITEHEDAWMNGYVIGEDGKKIDREDSADQGLVYCRANKQDDGEALPVCYRAKFR